MSLINWIGYGQSQSASDYSIICLVGLMKAISLFPSGNLKNIRTQH